MKAWGVLSMSVLSAGWFAHIHTTYLPTGKQIVLLMKSFKVLSVISQNLEKVFPFSVFFFFF